MRVYKKCYDSTKVLTILVELEIPDDAIWATPPKEQSLKYWREYYKRWYMCTWTGDKDKNDDEEEKMALERYNDPLNSNIFPPKSRSNYAVVTKIHGGGDVAYSIHDKTFEYRVEQTVKAEDFDPDLGHACGGGIHFFLDKQDAINYGNGTIQYYVMGPAIVDKEE